MTNITLSNNEAARRFSGIAPTDHDVIELGRVVGVHGPDAHHIVSAARNFPIYTAEEIRNVPLAQRVLIRAERAIRMQLGECESRVSDAEIIDLIPTAAVFVGIDIPGQKPGERCREKRAQLKKRVTALRKKHEAKY
ncbi:hypothetical protein [Leucobacter salsicius]|uniref:hypothetical protein n=1 Tax=Leucobacter salsicius TaxID=664638 RepID=UPI000348771C|nr:hypothetical protein [Leucobacter salsicius]